MTYLIRNPIGCGNSERVRIAYFESPVLVYSTGLYILIDEMSDELHFERNRDII